MPAYRSRHGGISQGGVTNFDITAIGNHQDIIEFYSRARLARQRLNTQYVTYCDPVLLATALDYSIHINSPKYSFVAGAHQLIDEGALVKGGDFIA